MKWLLGGLVLLTVFALGMSAGGGSPEPEKVTETRTVTESQTIEATPPSCLSALETAERVLSVHVVKILRESGKYPLLIAEAAQAGMEMDANAINLITEKMQESNVRIQGVNVALELDGDRYRDAAAECRAAASAGG